ncbi:MAG: saccharopine dehydrogenase NADP-binding domain-containing protein [Euryarchaeota archaeon]|nr:saccharopine dehydrogenase NADP-binding domain-containing protein [Euryarchaeota archaeon]
MRIVVLGGAGDMGRQVCAELARTPEVGEVVAADLDLARAQEVAGRLGEKARGMRADVSDPGALAPSLKGFDAVVGCVGPFYRFESRMAQACIAAGVDYVSLCDDFDAAVEVLGLHERAREAGVTLLTGLGNCPGITNLCAARAAQWMERLERVRIAFTGDARDAEGLANVEHALHMFTGEIVAYMGGKAEFVPAGSGREKVEFPPPIGTVPVYFTGHAEPVTLPRFIPGLQMVTIKGGITPPWLSRLGQVLVRLRLTSTPEKRRKLALRLSRLRPYLGRGGVGVSGLRVDCHGTHRGHPVHSTYTCVSPMAKMTAAPAAIGAILLARGDISSPGVYAPEGCVKPEVFFPLLEERGVHVEMTGEEPE